MIIITIDIATAFTRNIFNTFQIAIQNHPTSYRHSRHFPTKSTSLHNATMHIKDEA